jgi:DNA-binding transcriptional MerR regulator
MTSVAIPEKLFFKIGEVCELAGVQAHVLRYWETEFPMLAPQKNRAGQRTYRRRDVEMALRIKELLYDEQYTIAGAKKKLANELRTGGPIRDSVPATKAPVRSLKPPPSLVGRISSAAPQPVSEISAHQRSDDFNNESKAELRRIAAELKEILNMLNETDAELRKDTGEE